MPKVSEAQLNKLIEKWKPRLGLAHWDITTTITNDIADDEGNPVEKEIGAVAKPADHYEEGRLFFRPWLLDSTITPPSTVNRTKLGELPTVEKFVIHELIHFRLYDQEALIKCLGDHVSGSTLAALEALWYGANERVTDRLAIALYEAFEGDA